MSNTFRWITGVFLIIGCTGCFKFQNPYTGIAPGPWRAVLELEPKFVTPNPKGKPLPEKMNLQFEEVSAGELPFVFEVIYDSDTEFHIAIKNATEEIVTGPVKIGRDIVTGRDTILIDFPVFDSQIKGFYEENIIEGKWIVNNRTREGNLPYEIPFLAKQGQDHRFTTLRKPPIADISGRWESNFEIETDAPYKAVGEFVQEGNYLSGTFMTETGDYRFLEGTVQDDKVYLSCFDGSHAFLFEAKIKEDGSMIGSFRSGIHYQTLWEAKRNEEFTLTDPNQLTFLKEGYDRFEFTALNTSGDSVSSNDAQFQGKAKIIQLMGTWCPNCRDETDFLTDYLANNEVPGLEVIALAFEKHKEQEKALSAIRRFKKYLGINYPVLWAGNNNKSAASSVLPMLNQVTSFPTMIFIDKNDQVQKIHTGFNGPATSEYQRFRSDFDDTVKSLIAE